MLKLHDFMNGLMHLRVAGLQVPEIQKIIEAAIAMIRPEDQDAAKNAYADLIANNVEGHARFQEKLREAAQET